MDDAPADFPPARDCMVVPLQTRLLKISLTPQKISHSCMGVGWLEFCTDICFEFFGLWLKHAPEGCCEFFLEQFQKIQCVHMLQHAQNPKKWNSQFWENIHHSSSTY
jgi:hypothetical protein